jgi:hypothetical protein
MMWKLIRRIPYVHKLEEENIRLRRELEFERTVSGNMQKAIDGLVTHRDILLSSLDAANRELTRLRARRNNPDGRRS